MVKGTFISVFVIESYEEPIVFPQFRNDQTPETLIQRGLVGLNQFTFNDSVATEADKSAPTGTGVAFA